MKGTTPIQIDDPSLVLLQSLLRLKPSLPRRTTLLEAMEMGRSELPQSLMLAWLLGSQGPLSDYWMLKRLFHLARPAASWPGTPQSVLAEVSLETERPDVVASWESFKLIIEYKVDSPEGKQQIDRYLKTFKVTGCDDGMIIYLTPSGRPPASVTGDPRVYSMSFQQLIDCIDQGLADGSETTERGRVLVSEYRDCLRRVLNRSINVAKPVISEATRILAINHEHFQRLNAAANNEAAELIEYLAAQAENQLRSILGPDMVVHVGSSYGYYMFRKPSWVTKDLHYGLAYGCEGKLGQKAMQAYGHALAVRVQPLVEGNKVKEQKAFAASLHDALVSHVPGKINGHNQWFGFYQDLQFNGAGDWIDWADMVVKRLADMARVLTPHIDAFAATVKGI